MLNELKQAIAVASVEIQLNTTRPENWEAMSSIEKDDFLQDNISGQARVQGTKFVRSLNQLQFVELLNDLEMPQQYRTMPALNDRVVSQFGKSFYQILGIDEWTWEWA